MNTRISTKNLVTYAMLAAVAYVVIFVTRFSFVPAASFLKYDPKDVVVVISGFLYGPLPALAINIVASFVEMVTIGSSGPIGMLMTVLGTAFFVTPPTLIYRRWHSIKGAAVGLVFGCVCMVIFMLLWNYIMVPIYQGMPRAAVAEMLIPVFLPFNAIKSGLNASVAMILYKPVVSALRLSGLYREEINSSSKTKAKSGVKWPAFIISIFILLTLITVAVLWRLS